MRKTLATTILLALCGLDTAWAQTGSAGTRDVRIDREGSYLSVGMTVDLSALGVTANRAVLLTPCLSDGRDSVQLPSIGIYGRQRYIQYRRGNGRAMLSGTDGITYKASKAPDTLAYHRLVAYREWMDGAALTLHEEDYGCCGSVLAENVRQIGEYSVYVPRLVFVKPQAEKDKTRSLEGTAYIEFDVNQTAVSLGYHRNMVELGRIQATIDSVRNDDNFTITSLLLKGYASPEGAYAHNEALAKGRTEALRDYVRHMYRFADGVVTTDHEAEDWEGLRRYVEKSALEHRTEILAIIDDGSLDPDTREARIKNTYPREYATLLNDCYPSLRHTDYRVTYEVRTYSDVEEIKRVITTHPQNLSLDEFYLVAQEYEPGSDEFMEVFETAVRMYPDDEVANLNAANASIAHGDLYSARKYLDKAGESGEAEYARAVLAYYTGDYQTARSYAIKASAAGVSEANDMIQIEN